MGGLGALPRVGEMVDTELEFLRESEGPDWDVLKNIHSFTHKRAIWRMPLAGQLGRWA